jgi:hypothetical protein
MKAERRVFANIIKKHCDTLGVRAECPYIVTNNVGAEVEFVAYLPDFGSPNGMVIDLYGPESVGIAPQKELALKLGFYLSIVNPEAWADDIEGAIEALNDWGYYNERRERADFQPLDRLMARKAGMSPGANNIL